MNEECWKLLRGGLEGLRRPRFGRPSPCWIMPGLLAASLGLHAQTMVDLSRQGKLGSGTVLPVQCQMGQLFFKTDAPKGANLYTCTGQGAWSQTSGSPAGNSGDIQKNSSGAFAAAVAGTDYQPVPAVLTTSGATPVCDIGVSANVTRCEQVLTANVVASFQHLKPGVRLSWSWTQPATGGPYTVTYFGAANVCAVSPAAGVTTVQSLEVQADGTVMGTGCTTSDTLAVWRGPAGSAPATPASGLACWFDASANNWLCKDSSGNISAAAKTIAANPADHKYVVYIDGSGNQQRAQVSATDITGLAPSATTDTTFAGNISSGTIGDQRLSSNVELLNAAQTVSGSKTYTGNQNFSGAAGTLPIQTGTTAGLPASCAVGQMYFATDATAGANLYVCASAGTWTQLQSGASGGGGGGVSYGTTLPATCTAGSVFALTATYSLRGSYVYYPGTYTCVALNTWAAGANLLASGTGSMWPPFGGMPVGAPTVGTALGASNVMQCAQYYQPGTFNAAAFRTWVSTGDSGKSLGVNFYDTAGNLLGPTTTAGASLTAVGAVSGSIGLTMGPGSYAMCVASDSNSVVKLPMNSDGNAYAMSIAFPEANKRFFTCANHTSVAGGVITWPASCGTVSGLTAGVFPPWIMIVN